MHHPADSTTELCHCGEHDLFLTSNPTLIDKIYVLPGLLEGGQVLGGSPSKFGILLKHSRNTRRLTRIRIVYW